MTQGAKPKTEMAEHKFKPVDEQLAYIKKGVAEIITEPELVAKLENSRKTGKPLRVYLGVDPTAPDLHLGHTVVLRKLKHFQDLGHTAVFLIGDFSAMIGDPTGVSETRPPLTREQVDANAKTYLDQVYKILDPDKTEVRRNSDWLDKLSSYDIVRLCGHYQLSRLLEREDFRRRLESGQEWEERRRRREALKLQAERGEKTNPPPEPNLGARRTLTAPELPKTANAVEPISVHELLYPLLTAYDAVMLKSDVELGATEQKFNLLVHREIQREYGLPGQAILTMPILVGLDGHRKMSKSLGNYVGITEPPSEMFGKIMSISDDAMWSYYELLTDLPQSDISDRRRLCEEGLENPVNYKRELAHSIIASFQGVPAADRALKEFITVFVNRQAPEEMPEVRFKRRAGGLYAEVHNPDGTVRQILGGSKKWSQVLAYLHFIDSVSEAERLIKQRGLEINGQVLADPTAKLDAINAGSYEVRLGKKKFVRIIVE